MKKVFLLLTLGLLCVFGFGQTVPTVTTTAISNLSQIRANSGGNVTDSGGLSITNRGIIWSTSPNPTVSLSTKTSRGRGPNAGGIGSVVDYLTPLQPSTTYYVRAYATNGAGTGYGNQVTFTTSSFTSGRKYYISSSTGNNNNNGLSPSTPWKTMHVLYTKNTSNNGTFQPGDTICFKRGETFSEGNYDGYTMIYWDNRVNTGSDTANFPQYFTGSSGTKDHPIVITNYGDLSQPLPNVYFRDATPTVKGSPHHVWHFYGVSWVTIDGIQFNDTRLSYTDKSTPAYTTSALVWGEITLSKVYYNGANVTSSGCPVQGPACDTVLSSISNPLNRKGMLKHCVVKNCYFSNLSFGFADVFADSSTITYNTFINLKSGVDTTGTHDVMAGAIDGLSGFHLEISHNYFKGNWGKSGRNSSCQGVGGVSLDMFSVQNSKIMYNTCVDGRHFMEIGNLDRYDSLSGSHNDTFAFNKIINNTQIGYVHGSVGDPFQGNNHNLYFWNNVIIDNNKSRTSGPNYGRDIYGDGQSYSQFWFYSRPDLPNTYVYRTTPSYTSGNATLTLNSVTGVVGGDGTLKDWIAYQAEESNVFPQNNPPYVVSVNTTNKTVTLSSAPLSSGGSLGLYFYAPLSQKGVTWSQAMNPSLSTSGNQTIQYGTDQMQWGMGYDTLIDMRNNIFYNVNGLTDLYASTRTRFKHSNNIFYIKGGMTKYNPSTFYPSTLGSGAVLGNNERVINTAIFKDTTSSFPENWDLHLLDTSFAVGHGSAITGFNKDFAGVTLSGTMDIGLYKYSLKPIVVLVSSTDVTCKTSSDGSFTVSASNGTGPYTYKVNSSAFTSTTTYNSLAPGTYIVTVKDSKGVTSSLTITIKGSSVSCP